MDYFLAIIQHKEVVGALAVGAVIGVVLGANLQAANTANQTSLIEE